MASVVMLGNTPLPARHGSFHIGRGARQIGSQFDQLAILVDVENVFDPYAKFFFRNINARFDGKNHPRP